MNFSEIKKRVIVSNDEERIDLILNLHSHINEYTPISTKNFLNLYISFVLCHFESNTKYEGLKLYKKIIFENYFLFSEIEKEDILLLNSYYNQLFKNQKEVKRELTLITELLTKYNKSEYYKNYERSLIQLDSV